ncbi:MAG: ATP-binding protein [Candidatus Coatesbacteria bacterium]
MGAPRTAAAARFAPIFDDLHTPFFVADSSGKVVYCNACLRTLLDLPASRIVGRKCLRLFFGDQPPPIPGPPSASGQGATASVVVRSVENMTCLIATYPMSQPDGTPAGALFFLHRLTDTARSSLGGDDSPSSLRGLIQNPPVVVVNLDHAGRVATWNWSAERMFEMNTTEALGTFCPVLADDNLELNYLHRQRFLNGEDLTGVEVRRARRNGSVMEINYSISPTTDAEAKILGFTLIAVDVTELKRVEEIGQRRQEEIRELQKVEAIGRLAGGIAHDFNNIMTAVVGYSELLLNDLPQEGRVRRIVGEIHKAGQRATELTQQLLAFSRRQMLQPKVLDINQVFQEVEKLLQRLLGEDIEIVTKLDKRLWSAYADRDRIMQVILNLAVNARDAMPNGGKLIIESRNSVLDTAYAQLHPGISAGEYVALVISDTGHGMDDQVKAHLFEPFFTTKEVGKGTGLGLATVYGIIRQAGGHISVYSEVSHGTTFRIYLPRSTEQQEPQPTPPKIPEVARGGNETVLLAEDEASVRELATEVLKNLGYTVLPARNGLEALSIARKWQGPIHLLLTDIVMPRMGGIELASRLLKKGNFSVRSSIVMNSRTLMAGG